jgi:hypothetical protein
MKKQITFYSVIATVTGLYYFSFPFLTNAQNTFPASGNVGIGITTPARALHVQTTQVNGGLRITQTNSGFSALELFNASTGGSNYALVSTGYRNFEGAGHFGIYNYTSGGYNLFINGSTGNVGIGTMSPGSFKLAVEGKIAAREVLVTNTNPFPDYVFDKGYTLLSLPETEAFINANKHLPEIPSACEVQENNGINVGEMGILQMKKIEELYLHLIAINKKVDQLQEENKQLHIQLQQAGK